MLLCCYYCSEKDKTHAHALNYVWPTFHIMLYYTVILLFHSVTIATF